MTAFNVDMSKLPKPAVIEEIDYEVILQEWIERYQMLNPDYIALTESDPAYKLIETAAYREVLFRQRVNDATYATMLAYSNDEDLENLGFSEDVDRLVIDEGDLNAIPPREPVMESNDAYRYRIRLSKRAKNTAGSGDDYEFFALSADGRVKSVSPFSPANTLIVYVSVLSHDGDGTASDELLAIVEDNLSEKVTRPLSDKVIVQSAIINEFQVDAELELFPGPDQNTVIIAAKTQLETWLAKSHQQGFDVTLDGFYAALRVEGVYKVHLNSPDSDIINDEMSAAYASSINITIRKVTQ
ncbi:baseplate assembly protein [Shewanella surugensis]|uniref:Baseplate J/gp47 family protein n=1 Tax=Shewanella surugensis TaxID=212020 RepID=A0ABT0L8Y4_9GAMM|nr:baseplate J/gp47 family protein [Shewanella surugensis]MCL1124162.1 baseplate J/gp47 family protein [Shewanella surugensis]